MNKKVTVVLGVLVLALVAYIALFERGSLTSKELEGRKDKVLTTFVRDKVVRLTVQRGAQKVTAERELASDGIPGKWKLIEPRKGAADQEALDKLLGELEWLQARRILADVSDADLATFGLSEPSFSVLYKVSDDLHALRIGKQDVHGDSYYAQVDGVKTAYVVPKTVVEALDHEVGHYRDKAFLGEITSAWARSLTLTSGKGAFTVQRENGAWWVQNEPKSYGDSRLVSGLVDKLDLLCAVRFLVGKERDAALAALKAGATAELRVVPDEHREDKKPETFVLRFAGDCVGHPGERYAQAGEGDPVCVAADDLAPFDGDPDMLRLRALFDADPSEIEKLELSAPGTKLTLKREGEKWLREGGVEPDREAVEQWLADLKQEQAVGFEKPRAITAQSTLTLWLASETKRVLSLASDGNDLLVQRDTEPALVRFPGALLDRLSPFEGRFAALEPWASKQPSQVLASDAQYGALQRKLTLQDGSWQAAKGVTIDEQRVREQVRALVKLRVLSVLSNHARPEHGLDKPRGRVALTLNEGAPLSLTLGAKSARGSYARVGDALVVEVGSDVEQAVSELAGGAVAKAPEHAAEEDHDEHEHHDHVHE